MAKMSFTCDLTKAVLMMKAFGVVYMSRFVPSPKNTQCKTHSKLVKYKHVVKNETYLGRKIRKQRNFVRQFVF